MKNNEIRTMVNAVAENKEERTMKFNVGDMLERATMKKYEGENTHPTDAQVRRRKELADALGIKLPMGGTKEQYYQQIKELSAKYEEITGSTKPCTDKQDNIIKTYVLNNLTKKGEEHFKYYLEMKVAKLSIEDASILIKENNDRSVDKSNWYKVTEKQLNLIKKMEMFCEIIGEDFPDKPEELSIAEASEFIGKYNAEFTEWYGTRPTVGQVKRYRALGGSATDEAIRFMTKDEFELCIQAEYEAKSRKDGTYPKNKSSIYGVNDNAPKNNAGDKYNWAAADERLSAAERIRIDEEKRKKNEKFTFENFINAVRYMAELDKAEPDEIQEYMADESTVEELIFGAVSNYFDVKPGAKIEVYWNKVDKVAELLKVCEEIQTEKKEQFMMHYEVFCK